MSIPCKMRPAGLESLPLGYTRLEFLEGDGNAYILAGLTSVNLSMKAVYRPGNTPVDVAGCQRYAQIDGKNQWTGLVIDVNGNANGLGYYAAINHPGGGNAACWDRAGGLLGIGEINQQHLYCYSQAGDYVSRKVLNPSVRGFDYGSNISVFGRYGGGAKRGQLKIYSFSAHYDGLPAANYIPSLDIAGRPCMFDLVTRKPFYNQGTGEFIAGLTMGQARNLANLPSPTTINTLTISLPKEARLVLYNQEVNAAIAAAQAKGWTIDVQYRDTFDDEAIRDKYAECVTVDDMIAVNPDYKNDLTEDGEWIYPLDNLIDPSYLFANSETLESIVLYLPKVTTGNRILTQTKNMTYAELKFNGQNVIDCYDTISRGSKTKKIKVWNVGRWVGSSCFHFSPELEEFEFEAQSLTGIHSWFSGDYKLKRVVINDVSNVSEGLYAYENCYALEEFPTTYSALSNGNHMFRGCRLKKQHAVEVLSGIPSWTSGTHNLTIGIHVDYQNDEEVIAAITAAEEKGWTLTVQWNGTPTAQTVSTFGLRKPSVYAKLAASERPDGTTENFLDWGHYVTNWQENGYMEFASIEEAYEHFNLEMPAEEEYSN